MLPFYYLMIYLLAALGIYLVVRAITMAIRGQWVSPPVWASSTAIGALALFVGVSWTAAMGYNVVPLTDEQGVAVADENGSAIRQMGFGPLGFDISYSAPVQGWATHNYSGLEGTDEYPRLAWARFEALINEMDRVGRENGCGRSLWEFDKAELEQYGTPMSPMMLPYFTDQCIGSQEGLYFEASSTTPFHFIMQDELSQNCSCAQRFDQFGIEPGPYGKFDIALGVDHLQMLGIRYYIASTAESKTAADGEPRLTQVGATSQWTVYEVEDADPVVGLDATPAVWADGGDDMHHWAPPAVDWFTEPDQWDVLRAGDGPEEWERIRTARPEGYEREVYDWLGQRTMQTLHGSAGTLDPVPQVLWGEQPERREIEPVEVSNYSADNSRISFEVSEVGKPVLVRTSFFPHWQASGAEGPYRVAPNQMVVIPTDTTVELDYGRGGFEWLGWLVSLLGFLVLTRVALRWDPSDWPAFEFLGDRDDPPPPPTRYEEIIAAHEHEAVAAPAVGEGQMTLDLDGSDDDVLAGNDSAGNDSAGGEPADDGSSDGDPVEDRPPVEDRWWIE